MTTKPHYNMITTEEWGNFIKTILVLHLHSNFAFKDSNPIRVTDLNECAPFEIHVLA